LPPTNGGRIALSENYTYFSNFSLTAEAEQVPCSKHTLSIDWEENPCSIWSKSVLNRNLCSWKKRQMPKILQILSKSMQAKNRNVNKDNEAVTCAMPVNFKEFFECQIHLEYRRSKIDIFI